MTLITFQDGAVVFRDGKVGTEQACCCGQECDLSAAAEEQPAVSMATDCNCEVGTLDGNYSYTGVDFNGYGWGGTSTCDVDAVFGEFLAPVSVNIDSNCVVGVSTYQLGEGGFPSGLSGTADGTGLLSVDANGNIVGTVSVPLENFNGVQCTATLVFGP
jgi:hypothetical protein